MLHVFICLFHNNTRIIHGKVTVNPDDVFQRVYITVHVRGMPFLVTPFTPGYDNIKSRSIRSAPFYICVRIKTYHLCYRLLSGVYTMHVLRNTGKVSHPYGGYVLRLYGVANSEHAVRRYPTACYV